MVNTSPIFVIRSLSIPVRLAYANTASDGSGTLTTLVTGGENGTLVTQVVFRNCQATVAASAASLGKIFLGDMDSPETFHLIGEIAIPAVTRSATVIGANATFTFSPPIFLEAGQIMKVCQSAYASAAAVVDVTPYGGHY